MKIYSSEEGRCLETAGSFCKGFLDLEGERVPIIESMVRKNGNIADTTLNNDCGDDEF